jgi:hypothetical protein
MIEGLKAIKKVDDTIKNATKEPKKKKTARPTCKRDEEEEQRLRKLAMLTNPTLKFIGMQIEKLENMHVILTAEDGMSKY